MIFSQINKDNIKITCNEVSFFETSYNGIKYTLILKELTEIRMSVYVYNNVKLFKENTLIQSGEMPQPDKYYNPFSPNSRYVNIPLRKNGGVIDLSTGTQCSSSVGWVEGNIFNQASSKMIVNAVRQFKVIDLINMNTCYHLASSDNELLEAFFLDNDTIAYITNSNTLEMLNLKTNQSKSIRIQSPFEKFKINPSTYQPLKDKQTHCLALPSGGMAHTIHLNNWQYVNTNDKLVFKTLLPTSDIKYSEGYNRDYCDVTPIYVELKTKYF